MAAPKDVRRSIGSEPRHRLTMKIVSSLHITEALGTVAQADVAAEREIAERAGNQQNLASTQEKKDR